MKQVIWIISCYLYGAAVIILVILLLLVYTLIAEEKLKPDETRKFVDNSFRDGVLKTTGTDVDRILPPVSRFGGGNRTAKKDGIIAKLQAFFDKYFGLI